MSENTSSNALVNETSPYLLQHAHNPVAWYPWCDEALQRANDEKKPILLSIGYSACHWCHVMAHESFEDDETAALMNQYFINIKVDREERPDLDKIYQTAQQLLTRRTGGWPLTMFLTHDDHVPFFGGTYFPPVSRYGMPGFKDVLQQITAYYQKEQSSIRQQNQSLLDAFKQIQEQTGEQDTSNLDTGPLFQGVRELSDAFDTRFGGFGGAPKFPSPSNIEHLLHHYELYPSESQTLQMGLFTLKQMALGGIYDQLGGGFCRYSVDDRWLIPHFEKMLYDNGQLLTLYSYAWRLSKEPLFKKIAQETADWLILEMQSAEGGYYSSLDADSEGEEGKFYLWTREQLKDLLAEDEYELFTKHLGLDQAANFEGKWHLYVSRDLEDVAKTSAIAINEAQEKIDTARKKLYDVRKKRIWPGRDDKILTSWNALVIKGMAIASVTFDREDYFNSAERSLQFIHENMWQNGKLLATCKDGKAHLNAYLDDYAFLIDAILNMLSAKWSNKWLDFAIQLAENLLDNFYDEKNGGFYFTSNDHEKLIQRRKDFMDEAVPAGNGIAAVCLNNLGHLINEQRYVEASERTLSAAWPAIQRYPSSHNSLLLALENFCSPPTQLILRGEKSTLTSWQKKCQQLSGIRSQIYAVPSDTADLPDIIKQRKTIGNATAYLCRGFNCLAPVTDLNELEQHLKESEAE